MVQNAHDDELDLQALTAAINMADKSCGFTLPFPLARMVWGKLGEAKFSAGDFHIWAAMLFEWNIHGRNKRRSSARCMSLTT